MENKNGWLGRELMQSTINDARIINRLIITGNNLSLYPEGTIPQACKRKADIKGAYRLFDNKKVTTEGILSGHREETVNRMKDHRTILLVQDTTFLNYSRHTETAGLGNNSGYPQGKGFLLHTTLAVSDEGIPLGIMAQKYWTREPEEWGKKARRRELRIEEKESYRWLEALEESNRKIPDGIMTVTVADREADIYDLFVAAKKAGRHVLIRATGSRKADGTANTVYSEVFSRKSEGEITVTIPRNSRIKHAERVARMSLRYCRVQIKAPLHRPKETNVPSIELYAILLNEECPPEGIQPVNWLLLTTIPVTTIDEAQERLRWYKYRWLIERFHYTLKSGCTVEDLQLETVDRLKNAIALYSIIAWKILWLAYEIRRAPNIACDKVLSINEWQCAYIMVHEVSDPPQRPPTLREASFLIARLGGFMCRKGDGDPGVKVLWRGYMRVHDLAAFWQIKSAATLYDVGNG
jgi:hypothetical protein